MNITEHKNHLGRVHWLHLEFDDGATAEAYSDGQHSACRRQQKNRVFPTNLGEYKSRQVALHTIKKAHQETTL